MCEGYTVQVAKRVMRRHESWREIQRKKSNIDTIKLEDAENTQKIISKGVTNLRGLPGYRRRVCENLLYILLKLLVLSTPTDINQRSQGPTGVKRIWNKVGKFD